MWASLFRTESVLFQPHHVLVILAGAFSANTLSSESEIVKLIQAEEEGLVNAPAAQDAMWRMINDRKPSVVGDA
jgi:hypothetical protein